MNYIIKTANGLFFVISICITLSIATPEYSKNEVVIYNASGEITAFSREKSVIVIAVEIPEDAYIYANPKGDGIGKATEVVIGKSSLIESWEVRYPKGESYQSKGDTDSVNRYTKIVRIPIAFKLSDKIRTGNYVIKTEISALMCTSHACLPIERIVDIPVTVTKYSLNKTTSMMSGMSEFLSLKNSFEDVKAVEVISGGKSSTVVESGIPESIEFIPQYPGGEINGLFMAVLFGLIAGFILNFMPCVLPVVSLKIMSFVMNAGENRKVIATQGFLFSGGIIISFLILAALAVFSGHQWGALFQNRFFLMVMTSFIFAMALSLFGVFTFNIPLSAGRATSKKRGIYADAFIKGIAATLLATPCSGPFLGGTLAWTLTRPPEIIFIIFLSVGIGMALPYMLFALNPSLLRFLPKPGIWMNYFEKAMGFLLMFTVVYLLGIVNDTGRMGLILFLMFLSIGLWQFGAFGSIAAEKSKRVISFIVLLVIIAAGYGLSFNYFYQEKVLSHEKIAFSADRILKNRDNGIITVVEYTADWCPNCTLVESMALEKEKVQLLFARDDVEFMVADLTAVNHNAESLMRRLGSKSIPLLSVFPPGAGFKSPLCLRDIYSAEDVVSAVMNAEKFLNKK